MLGATLEVCDECAADASAAHVCTDVEMAKASDLRVVKIGIGSDATDANEPILHDGSEKELVSVVETDSHLDEIINEAANESKALGLTERRQLVETGEVSDMECAGDHRDVTKRA